MKRLVPLAALSALTALIAACGTYVPPGPPPPPSLVNTAWAAQTIDGQAVYGQQPVTLYFEPSGRIGGKAGCNSYFGAYATQNWNLGMSDVGSTKMACEAPVMRQEAIYLGILSTVDRFSTDTDGALIVAAPNGQNVRFYSTPR